MQLKAIEVQALGMLVLVEHLHRGTKALDEIQQIQIYQHLDRLHVRLLDLIP